MKAYEIKMMDTSCSIDWCAVFQGIPLNQYDVVIENGDFVYDDGRSIRLRYLKLTGDKFENVTRTYKDKYYMIFCDVYLYCKDETQAELRTHRDFLSSNCQAMLSCFDVQHMYLFSKSDFLTKEILDNCKRFYQIQCANTVDIDPDEFLFKIQYL